MNPGADHGAAFGCRFERRRHQRPDRREDERGIERLGRPRLGGAGPFRAEADREVLADAVAGAGEGEDALAAMPRDLRDDMRRGAETINPQTLGLARHAQGAIADKAGAKQRRRRNIVEPLGQREAEARIGDSVILVAGAPFGMSGSANLIKLHHVGQVSFQESLE